MQHPLHLNNAAGPRFWLLLLAACAATLVLARGTLSAPLVSEDASAVVYTAGEGALADFTRPQYDLRTVRFWRPLVTSTIGLQASWTGGEPLPLRLHNLLFHALSATLCGALAAAIGGRRLGAWLALAWAVGFPFLGGTAHWVVGRVDSQCLPLVLACAWFVLGGRRWPAALCAFGALATKESGAVAPAVAVACCLARGDDWGPALRSAAPAWAALLVGVLVRRIALGMWVGGYAVEGTPSGGGLGGAAAGLASAADAASPWIWALPAGAALGLVLGRGRPRAVLFLTLAALGCLVPLLPLLANGELQPVHRRWLLAPDALWGLALALGVAGGAARSEAPGREASRRRAGAAVRTAVCLVIPLVAIGVRLTDARLDLLRWTAAGETALAVESEVRRATSGQPPTDRPVLVANAPRLSPDDAAYVLQWGLADRFRAPFDETPRPVWPWRPLFNATERDRRPAGLPHDGLRQPFGEARPTVPEIPVALLDGGREWGRDEPFVLDARILTDMALDAAPLLVVEGEAPGERYEWLLFTELGHGSGLWSAPGPAFPAPAELPLARRPVDDVRLVPLRVALTSVSDSGLPLYSVLRQAADFGAERAFLQLRGVDDARGIRDRPIAASRWIELVWDDAWRRTMLPR